MIAPDLFEFAYVPDWYGQLEELERLALPESWKFRKPSRETKNTVTPILERYIHTIFRKQVIDFNSESDTRKADGIFHLDVCNITGVNCFFVNTRSPYAFKSIFNGAVTLKVNKFRGHNRTGVIVFIA